MAARKLHIIWAQGKTYCGRLASPADVHAPDEAAKSDLCSSCLKSYGGAHVIPNIYSTAGNPL